MKKLLAPILASTALVLASAPGASAATEVGSNCEGTAAVPFTVLPLEQAPGGLPLQAPSAGVVTQWKTKVPAAIPPGVLSQSMRVFRATAMPNQFQVVGVSAAGSVTGGANSFETRIPIQAGDQIGLSGGPPTGTLYCPTANAADKVAGFAGVPPSSGTVTSLGEEAKYLVPAVAVIEPDADNDGYGDETQDKCPQSAAHQTECPVVSLEALTLAGRKSVTALVATTNKAPVSVTGTVTVPKIGKKARKTIQFSAPTQTVDPGRIGHFELLFPGSLLGALKALPAKRSLTVTVTVSAPDVIGRVTTTSSVVQLKGQAKPKKRKAGSK